MTKLAADFRIGFGMDEIHDALPRSLVLRGVHAGAARRDPPFRADAGHLGADQGRTTFGALAVMHEVPIWRAAVDSFVLRPRGDHHSGFPAHVAELERREHRPPNRVVAGPGEPL